MKRILFFIIFITPLYFLHAQDSIKVETPKIITKLKVDNRIDFDKKSIHFIKVINESRCPTGAQCIWAGQAIILIGIYENNILIEEKEITFGADGITPDSPKEILITDKKTVYGYQLKPHPSATAKTDFSNYYLELLIK